MSLRLLFAVSLEFCLPRLAVLRRLMIGIRVRFAADVIAVLIDDRPQLDRALRVLDPNLRVPGMKRDERTT